MMRRCLWIGLVSAALASACNTSKDKPSPQSNEQAGKQPGTQAAPGATGKAADSPESGDGEGSGTKPATGAGAPGKAQAAGKLEPLAENPTDHQGTHRWSTAFGGGEDDGTRDVAMDAQGQVAVTGYYSSGADFGDGQQVLADKVDVFVGKYAPDGKRLWTTHFGGKGEDLGNAVAFDPEGNLVVVGLFSDTMSAGALSLTAVGSDDIFIAKLGLDGTPLWARRLGGDDSDAAHDVAIGADGSIYITGSFTRTMNVAGEPFQSKGNEDVFLLKLDSKGDLLWGKRYGGYFKDVGQQVAVDSRGHVVLLAEFTDEVAFGGAPLTNAGNRDLALVKLDADGQHLWSRGFGGPFDDLGLGLAVDPAGNIALTGTFDHEISLGGEKLVSQGESDVYVAKLSPDGEHLWSRSFGAARADFGLGVAVDKYGNVAVTGWFWRKVDFGGGPIEAASPNKDIFLCKLSATGEHLWSRRFGAQDHDQGRGVAMTPEGAIAATGMFRFTLDLGGAALESVRAPEDKAPPTDVFVGVFDR